MAPVAAELAWPNGKVNDRDRQQGERHHSGLTRAEKAEGRRAEFPLRVAAAEAFRPEQLEEQVAQRAEKEAHQREVEVAFHKAGAVEAVQHRLEGEGEALQTEAGEVFRKEGEGAGCQAAVVAAELLLLHQLVVERGEQLVGFQPEAEVGERLVELQLEVEVEPLEVFRPGEAVEEHFRQVAEEDWLEGHQLEEAVVGLLLRQQLPLDLFQAQAVDQRVQGQQPHSLMGLEGQAPPQQ